MLKLPENVKEDMRMYRSCGWNVPQSYVDFHHNAALNDLEKRDWTLLNPVEHVLDGWCDGNKLVQVHVLVDDEEMILQWHESGAWFMKHEFGGSSRKFEMMS